MKREWIVAEIVRILEFADPRALWISQAVIRIRRQDEGKGIEGRMVDEIILTLEVLLRNLIQLRVWITVENIEKNAERGEEDRG